MKKIRKKINIIFLSLFLCLLTAGCSSEISIRVNSESERLSYDSSEFSTRDLGGHTINLLENYQLMEDYEKTPEQMIRKLEQLYQQTGETTIITALADTALQIGLRTGSNQELRIRYFLAAAFYSNLYLKQFDNREDLCDEQRIRMIRNHNLASTELFYFLKKQGLERAGGYQIALPGKERFIQFSAPVFDFPISEKEVADFTPCAGYSTRNLTHNSKVFGVGIPLIATLRKESRDSVGLPLPGFPLGVTAVIDFKIHQKTRVMEGQIRYLYARTQDSVLLGNRKFPLAADFSTPLAKASAIPPAIHFLRRTFKVEEASDFSGLYLFEPYDENRIPIVLIHGLMSDIRTWGQMINTLLHDKEIRKRYQFLGFSYSSGNPVFSSAAILRKELQSLRERLKENHLSTEKFDQMVLIGHSMGGLLSRLQISSCSLKTASDFFGIPGSPTLRKEDSAFLEIIEKNIHFEPLPFVRRVIFIAVPHRGSEIAQSWIGKWGASLIELPIDIVKLNVKIINELVQNGKINLHQENRNTGIDNLRPDSRTLLLLNHLPISKTVHFHSIIGNRKEALIPGGTDGIVPYWSSHLDHADSELIVKSDHSVHSSPVAIQEVRQLLLLHIGKRKHSLSEKIQGEW